MRRQTAAPRVMTSERWWLVVVAAFAVVGVLLRVAYVNSFPGLNPDEVETSLQWFRESPIFFYRGPSRPLLSPIAPILLWPIAPFVDPAPWVVRLPALLAGISVLPVTFLVVRRLFGTSTSRLVTCLACTSPILIAYSRVGWDPEFIPIVTIAVLGFAYRGRFAWAGALFLLLTLIHPTAAFVIPLAAAPWLMDRWRSTARTRHGAIQRAGLVAGCAVAYIPIVIAVSATFHGIALPSEAAELSGMLAQRLMDVRGLLEFVGGFLNVVTGPAIYATFLGSDTSAPPAWFVMTLGLVASAGTYRLWRQNRRHEVAIVVALAAGLLAQYIAMGTVVVEVARERHFLWAVLPALMSLTFLLRGAFQWRRLGDRSLVAAVVLGWLGAGWFVVSYLSPFIRTGGVSPVLDYRSAVPQPKIQVLETIRANRQFPESRAEVFVGESRLHLGLLYLASKDERLTINTLGLVLYDNFQTADEPGLIQLFERFAQEPRDVFFVDYDWDRLPGQIREIHQISARPAAQVVAPWTLHELRNVTTTSGDPLIKVWRLQNAP